MISLMWNKKQKDVRIKQSKNKDKSRELMGGGKGCRELTDGNGWELDFWELFLCSVYRYQIIMLYN